MGGNQRTWRKPTLTSRHTLRYTQTVTRAQNQPGNPAAVETNMLWFDGGFQERRDIYIYLMFYN